MPDPRTDPQNLSSSPDFHVVGDIRSDRTDLLRSPGERHAADDRIAAVPLPNADPVHGLNGPLVEPLGRSKVLPRKLMSYVKVCPR